MTERENELRKALQYIVEVNSDIEATDRSPIWKRTVDIMREKAQAALDKTG